jgi:DNA repair exonuclease SbcCD ATPase subunit
MNLSSSSSESTQEFEKTLRELEDRKSLVVESGTVLSEKEIYYKELQKILGEDGIKKTIISRIIVPINHFLEENLSKMGVPFTVKLDENFNAEIMNFSQSIEQDSLSTGENKRINICIMIAYLKMIRTRKNINILFLDEVFSSIDSEGIESILVLLKDFAAGSGINIFVVHHAVMATEFFDRIISVSKDVFTQIEEISGQTPSNI